MAALEELIRGFGKWDEVEGSPGPMGATWVESLRAYNFALYSRRATGVTLLLYAKDDPFTPVYEYRLNARRNKSGRIWHCCVRETDANGATLYAYRVEGPYEPESGNRFDREKILLDPFAHSVYFPPGYDRELAKQRGPNEGRAPLGVLPQRENGFDWGWDAPPRHSHDLVVYELHVKGFTARGNSGVSPGKRGTFAGLIEKIPYLRQLGVTAVELMPVHQFDPQEGIYWGYMTLNFFAPHLAYAYDEPIDEFRRMVKAFHAARIEVWLDVVYNHTSEGSADGPTYSYRGIDNRSYYLLDADRRYRDDSGCGNTLRCDHPAVRSLVLESLRFWSDQMRVDGFRFDLASILTRKSDGSLDLDNPPLIADIGFLAARNGARLIAEAWDIQTSLLGRAFPGINWRQWNGEFRDEIRDFVRGKPGMVGALIQRLYGSDDLFPDSPEDAYRPYQSVNFVTAHDGFCLYDLVSYDRKHNEANGHGNRDGTNDNRSWNCGWEGDENVPDCVMALRRRQIKNFFTLLMLANGTPMFCAGDEFMNTQRGNNNPYNQDNETTWLNWDLLEQNGDMFRFFRHMIAFRKAHPSIARSHYWREDVSWYGMGREVDFSPRGQTMAYCLHGERLGDGDIYVMVNGGARSARFRIQEGEAEEWGRVVDTSLPCPQDIAEPGEEPTLGSLDYAVGGRSVVALYRPARHDGGRVGEP
ncbi:MAG: glycogen-debranching protein [Bryobacteraceae bacterium]|nr:glycogen-debranching protein [Bryobacteraceae bacterium]